jgi:hypothetical protein
MQGLLIILPEWIEIPALGAFSLFTSDQGEDLD